MTQSSYDELYVGTRYLDDLQQQLGRRFTAIVQKEAQRLQKRRENLKTHLKEFQDPENLDDDEASLEAAEAKVEKIRNTLELMPRVLRNTGAQFAGPRTLPKGQTTRLPLILRSGEGKQHVVGHFNVHNDMQGKWEMVGYESQSGRPKPLEQDVRSYQPDDLQSAMGEIDSFVDKVNKAASAYIKLDNQRSSGGVGMQMGLDAGGLIDDDIGSGLDSSLDLIGDGNSSGGGSGNSSSSSSTKRSISDKAMKILGTASKDGETLIRHDKNRMLSADEVISRLKKSAYKRANDGWFLQVKNNRESNPKKWKAFKKLAKKYYNKMLKLDDQGDPRTINQFWQYLGRACKNNNVLSENYCWTKSRSISKDRNGLCSVAGSCSRSNINDNGICKHQSYK